MKSGIHLLPARIEICSAFHHYKLSRFKSFVSSTFSAIELVARHATATALASRIPVRKNGRKCWREHSSSATRLRTNTSPRAQQPSWADLPVDSAPLASKLAPPADQSRATPSTRDTGLYSTPTPTTPTHITHTHTTHVTHTHITHTTPTYRSAVGKFQLFIFPTADFRLNSRLSASTRSIPPIFNHSLTLLQCGFPPFFDSPWRFSNSACGRIAERIFHPTQLRRSCCTRTTWIIFHSRYSPDRTFPIPASRNLLRHSAPLMRGFSPVAPEHAVAVSTQLPIDRALHAPHRQNH